MSATDGGPEGGRDPLERFEAEHAEALRRLDLLETGAGRVAAAAAEGRRDREAMRRMEAVLDFIRTEVRRHNEDEERALFPLLEDEVPWEPFAEEHRMLRSLEGELASALERGDGRRAARTARALAGTLRDHIERENGMLFPAARERLGADGLAEVSRRLEGGAPAD